jgi:LCP family protein required for cell wall assembly
MPFAYSLAERLAMKLFTNKSHLTILITCISIFALLTLLFSFALQKSEFERESTDPNNIDVSIEGRTFNFLMLGEDEVANLCDVIIIVSYDTASRKIEALQIPRDTYASYTSASYRKLNGALHSLGSMAAFADFIESSLGIPIDYYAKVDIDIIAETVDKLGGVELYIPTDMYYFDPYQDLKIDLKEGLHLLDGDSAVQFLRYRAGYVRGDIGRLDAQKIFLAALIDKILNDSSISDIIPIALGLIDKLDTNISVADCLYFIPQLKNIKPENIALMTMPGEDIQSQSGAWYYIINREEAYNLIKKYFSPALSELAFDPDRVFTSAYREGFNRIYDAKNTYKTERYTADRICREGINID